MQVTLNGRLMVLNKDNVGDFLLAMNRRIEVLERAIRQRGYRELSHTLVQAGSNATTRVCDQARPLCPNPISK